MARVQSTMGPQAAPYPARWRALLLPLLLAAIGCREPDDARRCPARFAPDAPRARAVLALLRRADEGARVLDRARAPLVCFGEAAVSVVITDGTLLLDARLADAEAAARAGHLLLHLADGLASAPPRPGDCDAQVDEALRAEARALALELRLRRALDVRRPAIAYDFEDAYRAAAPPEGEALVLAYLRAHPDGAPGVDALASAYARRCHAAQPDAAP